MSVMLPALLTVAAAAAPGPSEAAASPRFGWRGPGLLCERAFALTLLPGEVVPDELALEASPSASTVLIADGEHVVITTRSPGEAIEDEPLGTHRYVVEPREPGLAVLTVDFTGGSDPARHRAVLDRIAPPPADLSRCFAMSDISEMSVDEAR